MPQQKGANVDLVIGEETTFNTAASDGFVVPFNSSSLAGKQALIMPATLSGTRNPVKPIVGNRDVGGQIVVPVDATAFWYWLQMMFGDPSTTGTSAPYTHTFDIGTSMPSYTIETQFTDIGSSKYYLYTGCKVASWSMTMTGSAAELVANLDIVGAEDSQETSAFDGSPTTVSLDRLENIDISLTEGGSALSNCREASFTINFGLDTDQYAIGGEYKRDQLPEGNMSVTGNVKTLFEDDRLLDKAEGATETSLIITIQDTASLQMVIEFNEIIFERNSPVVPGPQGLLVDLNFTGYYDDHGDASAVVVALTNGDAHA